MNIFCYADALWNVNQHWIEWINRRYNKNIDINASKKEIIRTGTDDKISPEMLNNLLTEREFWNTLEPEINAVQTLFNLVEKGHQVFLCVDYSYEYISYALESLMSKFSFINENNIIKCSFPELLKCDVMIHRNLGSLLCSSASCKILYSSAARDSNELDEESILVANWIRIYKILLDL